MRVVLPAPVAPTMAIFLARPGREADVFHQNLLRGVAEADVVELHQPLGAFDLFRGLGVALHLQLVQHPVDTLGGGQGPTAWS